MNGWWWLLIVVVALVGLVSSLMIIGRRAAFRGSDPTQATLTPEIAQQARQLALAGRKVQAIKVVRDHTGMPLAAAKLVVDRMAVRPDDT